MRNFLFILLLLFPLSLQAVNTGDISGTVTDSRTGESLVGVTVQIVNSFVGTTTDLNGNFTLHDMEEGKYELSFTYIGYKTAVQSVEIKGNVTSTINVSLEESIVELGEITVQGIRPVSAASSQEIRAIDMMLKPFRSSQDMLLMVPGLFIAQHQGGGKAEQIFLRGFDCDHGTDVSINVDGMPVNMVTHAHGHGYADLHFLISETVDGMEVNKGPYLVDYGDFYTAGAINFKTKDMLEHNLVKVETGSFNTQKYTLMLQPENRGINQNGYLAMQYHHSDGPFIRPDNYKRMNVYGKYFFQVSPASKVTISIGGFSTGWNSSGQIPDRAVQSGLITRYGAIDDLEGGVTNRKNLILNYTNRNKSGHEFEINSFLTHYNFDLFSNFTWFLLDTVNGDMVEQVEHRTMQGLNLKYKFATSWFGLRQSTKIGGGYRGDLIDVQFWHSPNRIRLKNFTNDEIDEQNLNSWLQQEFIFSPSFRVIWGLRHDFFTYARDDQNVISYDSINTGRSLLSGVSTQSILSPKLNFIISPSKEFDIFLNFGQGFHSNDTRDVIMGARVVQLSDQWRKEGLDENLIDSRLVSYNLDPAMRNTGTMPKAIAGEFGMRTHIRNRIHLSFSAWYLQLDKEFVYAGDGAAIELSDPTRRLGIDVESRISMFPWLWADLDITMSDARIKNFPKGENYVPFAPRLTATGGISVVREKGLSGALRFRHLSERPGIEDWSVTALGYTIFSTSIVYTYKDLIIALNGDNILNSSWNEAQYFSETRLKGEPTSVTEFSYTPGNPRSIQLSVTYRF